MRKRASRNRGALRAPYDGSPAKSAAFRDFLLSRFRGEENGNDNQFPHPLPLSRLRERGVTLDSRFPAYERGE